MGVGPGQTQVRDDHRLVCPETKQPLRLCPLAEAEEASGGTLVPRSDAIPPPIGATDSVMLRADGRCAYPVKDGIPVLLTPEKLVPPSEGPPTVDLSDARYAEAYEEMDFYDAVGEGQLRRLDASPEALMLRQILELPEADRATFPEPAELWLDATHEAAAQRDAYLHLAPVQGKRVLQLGGKGAQALKFLLAGAAEAWTVSPMLGEALFGSALAHRLCLEDKFHCVVGLAEETPLADETFDAVYSGSCIHHMVTELAFAECARVLRVGGKFAAVEPWQAPLYKVGIRLFGKREDVHCRPLTSARAAPIFRTLDDATIIRHGALTRYPLLALEQLGLSMGLERAWKVSRVDDALTSRLPRLRSMGSSAALLGARQH